MGTLKKRFRTSILYPLKCQTCPRIYGKSVFILILAAAMCAAVVVAYRLSTNGNTSDRYGTMRGWQPIGGHWSEHQGIFSNATYGRGDMLIAQHSNGTNYTISADIRFDLLFPETHYGDAGLVIRTTNPEQGVDSYQGYYAGHSSRPADGGSGTRFV